MQNNKIPQVEKTNAENNKPLEQIQNELYVKREPKDLQSSLLENESEKFATTSPHSLCPSSANSFQQTRCKNLARRFGKVFGKTLKLTRNRAVVAVEQVEDIYVEVRIAHLTNFLVHRSSKLLNLVCNYFP